MKNKLTLSKIDLFTIITGFEEVATLNPSDDSSTTKIKNLANGAIILLLKECFGKYNTELIRLYTEDNALNPFETFDDLYDYLSDPYSYLVNQSSALPLYQLSKLFPNEEMFKSFENYVKAYNTKDKENSE